MEDYKDIIVWVIMGIITVYKIFIEPFLKGKLKQSNNTQKKPIQQKNRDITFNKPDKMEVESYAKTIVQHENIVKNNILKQNKHTLHTPKQKIEIAMENTNDEPIDIALKDEKDWRRAFLYSEIFQRKY